MFRTSPSNIQLLASNEVFVFGSNKDGQHLGGAAKFAHEKFGAVMGQGHGLQGQSYAIDTMSGIDVIKSEVNEFIRFADNNPFLTFLVTEIGCGIAGFTADQIAPLFQNAASAENVFLPESFRAVIDVVPGFKGFDSNMKCRDMQYEIGKTFEIEKDKRLAVCPDDSTEAGLHFCQNPLDVFGYYPPGTSRYCEVEGSGGSKDHHEDSKIASKRLFVKAEISLKRLTDLAAKFILEKVDWANSKESNTGYRSAATNTGDRSAATNTGTRSAATNTGDYSAATNTGDYSAATNTGDYSAATVEGMESVAISIGIGGKAKGKKGCFIVLAEWSQDENYSWHRTDVKSFLVDGESVKEDVFYSLSKGELIQL